jgi:hypothetical protein
VGTFTYSAGGLFQMGLSGGASASEIISDCTSSRSVSPVSWPGRRPRLRPADFTPWEQPRTNEVVHRMHVSP